MNNHRSANATAVALLIVATLLQLGVANAAAPARQTGKAKSQKQPMPMPIVAPLFIEDQDFTSAVVLVNATTESGSARLVLRNMGGAIIAGRRISISPVSDLRIEIGELLQGASSAETTGSIVLSPDPGSQLAAQLLLTYRGQPSPSYVDEELAMPMLESSPVLRAVAEESHGSPLVSITSLAASSQNVTISCLGKHGNRLSKTFALAPNATFVRPACVNSDDDTVNPAHSASTSDRVGDSVGIELISDGPPGGFAAFGLAPHRHHHDQYFSAIPFSDPKMIMSRTTVYPGVPVGTTPLLPSGAYTPRVSVANFGSEDALVTIKLAKTDDEGTAATVVQTVKVPGGVSRSVTLKGLAGDPKLRNSFLVTSDGSPGQIISKLVSLGDGPLSTVELLGKDEEDGTNGGTHPWSLESGADSTLVLFNHGNDAQDFHITIGLKSGFWEKRYRLKPMQTVTIELRELVEQQLQDDHGRILPRELSHGEIGWTTNRANRGKGRLLLSGRFETMARSFSCDTFYFVCDATVIPGAATLFIGGSQDFSANANSCISYSFGCDGNEAGPAPDGLSYYWSLPSLLTNLNFSSNDPFVSTQAVNAGSNWIGLEVSDMYCSADASAPITVNDPTPNITGSTLQAGTPAPPHRS
jgi:hypothetical protein